jgi:hypothetical protein
MGNHYVKDANGILAMLLLASVSSMASKDLLISFPNQAITCLSCVDREDGEERGPEAGRGR